ncbi:MAG: EF-hand domain-containing protein [Ignavibacteria bacterium]
MKTKSKSILIITIIFILYGCNSSNDTAGNRSPQDGRPTTAEIFSQMDNNKDGILSKEEVIGPLKDDFAKIDTNSDGFITEEELNNAPKPDDQRPNQQQQGPPPGRN